jgi:hypothetical protein
VDKLNPGKIVEVAMLTGDEEARGNNRRLARMLTAAVNVACTLRTVEIIFACEEAAAHGGKTLTARAEHPAGEEGHGNPAPRQIALGVWWPATPWDGRRCQEALHLIA